jgi:alpha-tubulin suppressor-like RCC1 family protein
VWTPTNLTARYVATGAYTTYLIEDGTNLGYAAGRNDFGQGGVGFSSPTLAGFTAMSGGLQWKQFSAGIGHWAGLTFGGDVYSGGENSNGQLGDGTTTNRSAPTRVNLPVKAWLVRAGAFNTCAALTDGALFCWGSNQYGQIGSPAGGNEHFPEYLAGNPSQPVTSIGIGEHHICYTRANVAGLWCRGFNTRGQLGDGTTTNRDNFVWSIMPPQTGAGAVTFSMPSVSQASQAADDMRSPLSAGFHSTCFAPLPENIDAAATNLYVLCTGDNQLGDVSDKSASAIFSPEWTLPGANIQFRERSAFGSLATPAVAGIMAGFTSNKVLTTDGRILGVGFGFWGTFGNGVFVNERQWIVMAGGMRFAKVASSPVAYHTCAIDDGKALWCWGRNDYGQLGIGATSTRETTPRRISKP